MNRRAKNREPARPVARRIVPAFVVGVLAAGVLACGCVAVKDTLTINADGSGSVHIETVVPSSHTSSYWMMSESEHLAYPPSSEEAAWTLFSGKDFATDVDRERKGEGSMVLTIEAEFKDINTLINSPYGRAHSLRLERDGDELVLTARSGIQHIAHSEAFLSGDYSETPMGELFEGAKERLDELAFEFTIVLPGEATAEGGGAVADGNRVTWSADLSSAEDPAVTVQRLDAIVTARCRADDLTFTPEPVVRLDLCAFDELTGGKLADAPALDVGKVKAAARFVPITLRVTRTFDLAGAERYRSDENGTMLQGAVIVPREFQPERWGEPQLTRAVDDQGTDLLGDEESSRSSFGFGPGGMVGFGGGGFGGRAGEDDEEEDPNVLQVFQTRLEPPGFDAEAIGVIAGTIDMYYTGARHVVRVKNAIEKATIVDTPIDESGIYGALYNTDQEDATPLTSDALSELGLDVKLLSTMRVPGAVVLRLLWDDEHGTIDNVQIFDADGRPWRTLKMERSYFSFGYFGGSTTYAAVVLGAPKAPLSLAIDLRTAGPKVTIPFEIRDVPLTPRGVQIKRSTETDEADEPAETDTAEEEQNDAE